MFDYIVHILWNDGVSFPFEVEARSSGEAEKEVRVLLREQDIDEGVVSIKAARVDSGVPFSMRDLDIHLGNERAPQGWMGAGA